MPNRLGPHSPFLGKFVADLYRRVSEHASRSNKNILRKNKVRQLEVLIPIQNTEDLSASISRKDWNSKIVV